MLLIPAAAHAQSERAGEADPSGSESEVIIVTATKTGATALQQTPMAISAFSASDVERNVINDVRDLVAATPNLSVAQNAAFAQIYIRGIGSNNVFNGSDPSAAIQIDGVYNARPFSQFANFLDVERIEVLRGPQGTLYGRNAIAGVVNVISRAPSNDFEARIQLTGGNFDLTQVEAYLSGPIVNDRIQMSIAGSYLHHDSYRENVAPGVPNTDDAELYSLRAQLRVQLSDSLVATTRADMNEQEDRAMGYGKVLAPFSPLTNSILGDFRHVAHSDATSNEVTGRGVSQEFELNISDSLALKSITAHRASRIDLRTDSDGTDSRLLISNIFEDQNQFTQELNLSGRSGALRYVAGLFYISEEIRSDNLIENFIANVFARFQPESRTSAWAGFAQADYNLTERLSVTAGLRYTRERRTFDQRITNSSMATGMPLPGFPLTYELSRVYDAFTPKIGLTYTADNYMLYASVTRGFKSGGFNMSSPQAIQGFDPEFLWSYEAGLRSDLFNRRLRFNLTAFYYDYSDLQVQAFIAPGVIDITNAATAEVRGLEAEAVVTPARGVRLFGSVALLDAEYGRYVGPGNVDFSGKQLNSAPDFTANIGGQYDWSIGSIAVSARAEYRRIGRQYFTPANILIQSQGDYGLLDGSISLSRNGGHWRVSLWGKNLLDAEYVRSTAQIGPAILGRPGDPRTFGVRLTWSPR